MFKIIVLCASIAVCHSAGGYGGGLSLGGGYGGGLSLGGGYGGSRSSGGYSSGPINAAVISRYSIDYRDVPTQRQAIAPQQIIVDSGELPLSIHFRSASSKLQVTQSHEGGQGGEERTSSQDEPYRLYHDVSKPIIQEVREVISPYRRVIQEIQPVQEEVQTIVARGQSRGYGGGLSAGAALGGGYGGGLSSGVSLGGGYGGSSSLSLGGGYGGSRASAGGYGGGRALY